MTLISGGNYISSIGQTAPGILGSTLLVDSGDIGAVSQYDLTIPSNTYKRFMYLITGNTDTCRNVIFVFNATGSGYYIEKSFMNNTVITAENASNQANLGIGTTSDASRFSFFGYFDNDGTNQIAGTFHGGNAGTMAAIGCFRSTVTNKITNIRISTSAGNFLAGTSIKVYGVA